MNNLQSKSDKIRRMLIDDLPAKEIATAVGCNVSYVYQVKWRSLSRRDRIDEKLDGLLREVHELKWLLRRVLDVPEDVIEARLRQIQ